LVSILKGAHEGVLMEFPGWTPPSLKELYNELYERQPFSDGELERLPPRDPGRWARERDLLIRLATKDFPDDWNMRNTWDEIERLQRDKWAPARLFFTAESALRKCSIESMARKQEEKFYKKIASKALDLIKACEGSLLDDTIYHYYPEDAAQKILNTLDPERVRFTDFACRLDKELTPIFDKSAIDFISRALPKHPTLSGILYSVNEKACELSTVASSRPRHTESPGGKYGWKRVFVSKMAVAFIHEFGEPCRKSLHRFCSVCWDEHIEEQYIKERVEELINSHYWIGNR
jgi:hypothetical protein